MAGGVGHEGLSGVLISTQQRQVTKMVGTSRSVSVPGTKGALPAMLEILETIKLWG